MTSPQPKPSRVPAFLRESVAYSWLGDAWEALQETADEALIAARRAARKTNQEQWRRYEAKVGHRRGAAGRAKQVIEGQAGPAKSTPVAASAIEELGAEAHPTIGEHASPLLASEED